MKNDSIVNYKVTVGVDSTKMLEKAMAKLAKRYVVVGYPEDKSVERKEGGIGNASLAFVQDRGSPANHLPPRPFLQPGVDSVSLKLQNRLAQGAREALGGDVSAVDRNLNAVGVEAVSGVRSYLTNANFAPLKASTLRGYVTGSRGSKGRKRRSDYGTHPLIVTGQLRNAVNYTLRDRKGL